MQHPTREQFDEIFDSLINGQNGQAVAQMNAVGMDNLPDLLDYFDKTLSRPETAIHAAKVYFRITA